MAGECKCPDGPSHGSVAAINITLAILNVFSIIALLLAAALIRCTDWGQRLFGKKEEDALPIPFGALRKSVSENPSDVYLVPSNRPLHGVKEEPIYEKMK
ncbi:hypothetical protein Y1Q_0005498 [Alligator mississippiensis]|uniref:Uncharacterized protein n=1 Tax=Alligator mississippiensis TaxID=8496 RepID=A0A151MEQ4_ALLMI|nr:hypothetical protein Y1Q_0005498 [Alligator mississippiensis]